MVRNNNGSSKSKVQLKGLFCLPTSSKYHCQERERSGAYAEGQVVYILSATQSLEEGGYPPAVVLTANEGDLELALGDEPDTQHAQVRKNLPPRRVTGIVMPDGSVYGNIPAKGVGLPHWEFIPANEDGSANEASIQGTIDRLTSNRSARELSKQSAREAKKVKAA